MTTNKQFPQENRIPDRPDIRGQVHTVADIRITIPCQMGHRIAVFDNGNKYQEGKKKEGICLDRRLFQCLETVLKYRLMVQSYLN
jgi:hypothetical protein